MEAQSKISFTIRILWFKFIDTQLYTAAILQCVRLCEDHDWKTILIHYFLLRVICFPLCITFFWGTWTRCVCVHREPCVHVFKHVWRHFDGHWTFNGWNEAYTQVGNLTLYLNFGQFHWNALFSIYNLKKKQISIKISTATNFAAFFDNSLKMFKCFPILTLFKFYGYFFHLGVCLCLPVCVYVCIYDAIKFN